VRARLTEGWWVALFIVGLAAAVLVAMVLLFGLPQLGADD